jgi:hypothetical protein
MAAWASLALGLACCLAGGTVVRGDDILPAPFPANRYQKMGAHSPFAPPTVAIAVPVAVVAPVGSWADKLSITSLMEQGGKYVAMVMDRDSSQHFLVSSDQENDRKMMLSSVQWADVKNTRVTIRKGNEFGQLAFDPSASASSNAAPAAVPGGGRGPLGRPGLPNPTVFHPPPGASGGLNGPNSPSIIRRPAIPAAPPTLAPRTFPGNAPQAADDDDDDDN